MGGKERGKFATVSTVERDGDVTAGNSSIAVCVANMTDRRLCHSYDSASV